MTPAKTATQIDRPERFHVEASDPAEMHEFLGRAYRARMRLCNRDSVRGDGPSLIAGWRWIGEIKPNEDVMENPSNNRERADDRPRLSTSRAG